MISRSCREAGVYAEILPFAAEGEVFRRGFETKGIILSGGPRSVYEEGAPSVSRDLILRSGVPVLGICYGHQLIAHLLGGRVEPGRPEYGRTGITILSGGGIFEGMPRDLKVWMSHSDYVSEVRGGLEAIAVTEGGAIAAMRHRELPIYGLQFHPEVRHTDMGERIIRNFAFNICGCEGGWEPYDHISGAIDEIRSSVGPEGRVVCAVSGGVDSVTTSLIVHRAIGDRLRCVFVDHGLMRKGEPESVMKSLRDLGINVTFIEASERFLSKLRRARDPEEKRRIVGEEFIRVFEEFASSVPGAEWLAQGTIYPDRIESAGVGAGSWRIKSHHNVAALPSGMRLKLIEPLKDLYKDEVRAVALKLGVPREIVERHPFPGPGLAVRIIGEVTDEKLRICGEANHIVEEEFRRAGLYGEVWQAFAVVGDDVWTGVKGDRRAEGRIVTIRAVTSRDGMTADYYKIPHELLERISTRITNEVPGVALVTYAASPKPPSTIEAC